MDNDALLALYDQEERYHAHHTDVRREVLPRVVRQIALDGGAGFIIWSDVDETTVDAEIEAQVAYFSALGKPFEWKVYGHDTPSDLRERLAARGFEIGEDEALMILDLDNAPDVLFQPITHDVRRITNPDHIYGVLTAQREHWGEDDDMPTERRLSTMLRAHPESIAIYAAYVDDMPVSAAWMALSDTSQFAGMWGGATLPEYRGRGLYTALVAARAQEARMRGKRFLTIDASPMSRPIVSKLGFRFVTYTWPCEWTPEKETT